MSNEQIRYWLCCGSRTLLHGEKTCYEAQIGHPERVRYGTANEHSQWEKDRSISAEANYPEIPEGSGE